MIINDFGEINVDAALVTGQVDEPASITGGCICCLPDNGGLDDALAKLADPRLGLDTIIVEASGLADPVAISRIIRYSGVERVRPGGVVDVIDGAAHFDTVDRGGMPPARCGAASPVVVNKLDQIPRENRTAALARIEGFVRGRNPHAHVVGAIGARVDPALLCDVFDAGHNSGQLSFQELLIDAARDSALDAHAEPHHHVHAASVTATSDGCIDPAVLIDLIEQPPAGVYRLKGTVAVRYANACAPTSSTSSARQCTSRPRCQRRVRTAWWRSVLVSTSTTCVPVSMPRCVRRPDPCKRRAFDACSVTDISASDGLVTLRSVNTRSAATPAESSAASCASRSWPRVLTLA